MRAMPSSDPTFPRIDRDLAAALARSGLAPLRLRGETLLPLVQGGMGVGVSAHRLAGSVAALGGVGTISSVGMCEPAGSIEIGYCIGSPWWGKGYVTEAMAAVMAFFFDEVKVNRVESSHDPNNPGSGRVMQKCGLKYEGTRRQADFNNRGIVDSALYGLTAAEYRALA